MLPMQSWPKLELAGEQVLERGTEALEHQPLLWDASPGDRVQSGITTVNSKARRDR